MADYDSIAADLRHELSRNKESDLLHKKLTDVVKLAQKASKVNVVTVNNPFTRFYYWITGTPVAHMRKYFDRESTKLKTYIADLDKLKTTTGADTSSLESIISVANQLHDALMSENTNAGTKLEAAKPKLTELTSASNVFRTKIEGQEANQAKLKAAQQDEKDRIKMEKDAKKAEAARKKEDARKAAQKSGNTQRVTPVLNG